MPLCMYVPMCKTKALLMTKFRGSNLLTYVYLFWQDFGAVPKSDLFGKKFLQLMDFSSMYVCKIQDRLLFTPISFEMCISFPRAIQKTAEMKALASLCLQTFRLLP
jgi:hypothetical protein